MKINMVGIVENLLKDGTTQAPYRRRNKHSKQGTVTCRVHVFTRPGMNHLEATRMTTKTILAQHYHAQQIGGLPGTII